MFKSLRLRTVVFMMLIMLATFALFNPSPPGGFGHAPSAEGTSIIKHIDGAGFAGLVADKDPGFAMAAPTTVNLGSMAETSSSRLWVPSTSLDTMTSTSTSGAGFQATYPVHRLRGSDLSDLDTKMTFGTTSHGLGAGSKPGGRSPTTTISITDTSST
jgi:hypothetical protein